jgi:hypothetical protein
MGEQSIKCLHESDKKEIHSITYQDMVQFRISVKQKIIENKCMESLLEANQVLFCKVIIKILLYRTNVLFWI